MEQPSLGNWPEGQSQQIDATSAEGVAAPPGVRAPRLAWGAHFLAWLNTAAGTRVVLVLILLAAAYLRLSHVDWDMGTHIHPDERFLTMVEASLQLPKNLGEFFNSARSPMNPYNYDQYQTFVYGTLPIFIVRVVAEIANKVNASMLLWTSSPDNPINLVGYDGVHFVGRTLSGLFDLACVWLIFVVARRLYGRRIGLLAAALYAFSVLPLQQSHFFTVDTFGTFFALLTFYFAVRVAQGGEPGRTGGGWGTYVGLGASLGASVACRINLAPLAAIAVLAAGIRAWDDWHWHVASARADARGGERVWLSTLIQATLFRLVLMGLVTIAVFRVCQPYAFGGTSVLDFSLSAHWLDNMRYIQGLMSGAVDYPPGHQWADRTAFVFPFRNMVIWGLGLPLGIAAWAGWLVAAWQVLRLLTKPGYPTKARTHLLPVAWIGGMFLWQGLQYVQSMRYLLPIYPMLAMMASWLLFWLGTQSSRLDVRSWLAQARGWLARAGRGPAATAAEVTDEAGEAAPAVVPAPSRLRYAAYALSAIVLIGTMLWGWGFLAIYRRPLTRVTASRWMYATIPSGSVVANEHWDDPLPLSIDGRIGFQPYGPFTGLKTSSDGLMHMYDEDTPEKREQLYQWLDEADYIVLSSNRLYGSIPRLPLRYPMTTLYYKLLFEGKLGFQMAYHGTSFPTIFGIQFDDTGAEEAFSVYDHPVVYIFKKTPLYSEANVRHYLDPIDLENTIQYWPKQVSEAPTALLMTSATAAVQAAGGTWSSIFDPSSVVNHLPVVVWLILLEVLGAAALPFAFVALRGLADRGYGVSKTLGILLLAWLSWIGPALKLLPYERWLIVCVLLLLLAGAAVLAWNQRRAIAQFVRERATLLIAEEAIFLVLFVVFLLVRWGNPDLWHPARGGEKPMDFAFLNAVIKSTTFPPYDPWFAGGFMNYYYFGFVIIGTLIKLTGIVPWVAYNLAVPTLFALTGLGAFTVAYNLADADVLGRDRTSAEVVADSEDAAWEDEDAWRWRRNRLAGPDAEEAARAAADQPRPSSARPLLAGFAALVLVTIAGNLGEIKLLFDQWLAHSPLTIESTIPGFASLLEALAGAWAWMGGQVHLSIPNDWWFWNASRVIQDTINEFPFFTFTYADLHAHMIALPLTLLGLATAVGLIRLRPWHKPDETQPVEPERTPWYISLPELLGIGLLGLVIGALRATNTWDFPTYIIIGVCALSVLEVSRRLANPLPEALDARLAFVFRAAVSVLWRALIMVAVASLSFYPFAKNYATAYAGLELWDGPTTAPSAYLVVHGLFLALMTIYLLSEWWAQSREDAIPEWVTTYFPVAVVVVFVLFLVAWILHAWVWFIALPLVALALMLLWGRDVPPARRFALLLIMLGLAITMGVEVVRQKDDIGRMNTVFKFCVQAWVLFGVASAFGLASWAQRARHWYPLLRRLAWTVAIVLFACAALYPPLAARAKILDRFSAQDQPHGLNGMAYMSQARYIDNEHDLNLAADETAIQWMLQNVQGSPVILEGNAPSYRWGNRFSIYTGLPAVMGWDWHEKQQRSVIPGTVIDRRLTHVQEMYNSTDLTRVRYLLDLYDVSYIIVGELERAYYTPEGLAKFDQMVSQGYLRLVYVQDGVRIYQVVGRSPAASPAGAAQASPFASPAAQPFTSPQ